MLDFPRVGEGLRCVLKLGRFLLVFSCAVCLARMPLLAQTFETNKVSAPVGELRAGMHELNLSLGGGVGMQILGSEGHHDWVLGVTEFGWVFKDVKAHDGSQHGSFELLGDLFGGYQFYEQHAYFVGITPLLRYNFQLGGGVVPFVNLGAGLTATDIRGGDLSTTFEFNLQSGGGAHFFVKPDLALTVQYRFIHFSNANIEYPNQGVNNSTFLAGVTFWW